MKSKFFILLLSTLFLLTASVASAKTYKIVFWYPGEAGTTEQAAPILQEFFDYINSSLPNDKLTGKYFNNKADGLKYIKNEKPSFGIISWPTLLEYKEKLPSTSIVAQTITLPLGKAKEVFTIVSNKKKANLPSEGELKIYTSLPLSKEFMNERLFPDISCRFQPEHTKQIMSELKKIATDTANKDYALLTPVEEYTLEHINAEWTTALKEIGSSKSVPTAALVTIGKTPGIIDKLRQILNEMPDSDEGKKILTALRLKGFKFKEK